MLKILVLMLVAILEISIEIQVIPLATSVERSMISVWSAAVELRNGDQYFISNKTQQAVIGYNFYVFQDYNLFYYRKRDQSITFIGSIPTHAPKALALVPNYGDGIDEGGELLVSTSHCLMTFDLVNDPYAQNVSIEAGHCYESGLRDGPKRFARFASIEAIAASRTNVWLVSDKVLGSQSRLCLVHGGNVITLGLYPSIHTMSVSYIEKGEEGELFVAICWERQTGVTIFWIPRYNKHALLQDYRILDVGNGKGGAYLFSQIVINSVTLMRNAMEGRRQLYLFLMSAEGGVEKSLIEWGESSSEYVIKSNTTLQSFGGARLISLYVDFPYGVFVAQGNLKRFFKVNTLGCVCPPGFALVQGNTCQEAPLGGYVDILGNFIPCPPGTMGDKQSATSVQACVACPPYKIAGTEGSIACSTCLNKSRGLQLLPNNPQKTKCLAQCPEGSYLGRGECLACPAGQSSTGLGGCGQCPVNTFSNPSKGILTCNACPEGTMAGAGASSCSVLCSGSACSPGACQTHKQDLVLTISVLGIKAVGAALAKNGTVYIAGYQLLITMDKSGSAINTPLNELSMVQDLALSSDEGILYAAITSQEILCFTFVGTPRLHWTRWVPVPGSIVVGLAVGDGFLWVHDAAANAVYSTATGGLIYSGEEGIITSIAPTSDQALYVLVQTFEKNQSVQKIIKAQYNEGGRDVIRVPQEYALNPHLAHWQGRLVLSAGNAVVELLLPNGTFRILAGEPKFSGRVDGIGGAARFTIPGPMLPSRSSLLVVDLTGLRVIHSMGCRCDADFYTVQTPELLHACLPCPLGFHALPGASTCSPCVRGQYTDSAGKCVPCPKMIWWAEPSSCPLVLDTMVGRDVAGLTMQDIFFEMSDTNPQHYEAMNLMGAYDYVSMHTLQLPLSTDSITVDNAARGRFWVRSKRITPPPEIFVSAGPLKARIVLPGFWIVCSPYVLQTETCSCELPAGGIKMGPMWDRERNNAASIDYNALRITPPPDPDLYDGGGIEYIHFMNITVAPTALFVSRTDAGGGADDDNPTVIYIDSIPSATEVPIPPPPVPSPSESSFAACVAGWPATYTCPLGFLWVAPLYTCVPCRAGFYHNAGRCLPCPVGTFSELEGSTECMVCASARGVASASCVAETKNSTALTCDRGYEQRWDMCAPCIPGFFKAKAEGFCSPCPSGTYTAAAASTACSSCAFPLVSTQWGSTECFACAQGYIPSAKLDKCRPCSVATEYYHDATCKNKTVLRCGRGYYIKDGGSIADNQCIPCLACREGEIMTPHYDPHPCNYDFTTAVGAPYRCIPVESLPGMFARLALQDSDYSVQYTQCEGLPSFATWTQGPDPTLCFFKCNYAISEAAAKQYAYYYAMEAPDAQSILSLPPTENLFLLDYPGLSAHLMLLSKEICLSCPKSQCGWGRYRPITDFVNGCGPPTCVMQGRCQVVPGGVVTQYENDGCTANCTLPRDAYLTTLSLPGTGDNCGWACKLGFFLDITLGDKNETEPQCTPCVESVCERGEMFLPHKCLPDSTRETFCVPCPEDPRKLAVMVGAQRGVCQYECIPGAYPLGSGLIPNCISCTNTSLFCPSGFRRVCSKEACAECPALPISLWGSAVKMPSNKNTCQAACRSGYHTLDLASGQVIAPKTLLTSYDMYTIACTLCSLRPTIPCTSSNMCSAGYYMPVLGSGICKPCPTVYDCGAGFGPSPSCICTVCKTKVEGAVFIHQRAAEALPSAAIGKIVIDFGTCPAVCPNNHVLMDATCTPCSTLLKNTEFFTAYYSVWNASDGVRWWDAAQDPAHLPSRTTGQERRAGLCWPCPAGTITGEGDKDLCQTTNTRVFEEIMKQPVFDSSDVALYVENPIILFSPRRSLLSVKERRSFYKVRFPRKKGGRRQGEWLHPVQERYIQTCPPFAHWDEHSKGCVCKSGFRMQEEGICAKNIRDKMLRSLPPTQEEEELCSEMIECPKEKYKDAHGNCRLCPFMHAYDEESKRCISKAKNVTCPEGYMDWSREGAPCVKCPGNMSPFIQAFNYPYTCACPKGTYYYHLQEECRACERGTYSSHMGLGPCLMCPEGLTTAREGAESAWECVEEGVEGDQAFVHPNAQEFFLSESEMLWRRLVKK